MSRNGTLGGAPPKVTLLPHTAARYGQADVIGALLAKGANPNATADDGATTLMNAVVYSHVESVRLLLKGGADVNTGAPGGMTALKLATNAEIIRILQVAGAKE